jgi:hypothetical protein
MAGPDPDHEADAPPVAAEALARVAAGGWSAQLGERLAALYRELDREVEATGAVCRARGVCCDFPNAGHVLYASSAEIAYVLDGRPGPFDSLGPLCPFWADGLCGNRARRPLGCRTYFCDPAHRDALEGLYEKYYRRLRALAEEAGLQWSYEPFVGALRADAAERGRGRVER